MTRRETLRLLAMISAVLAAPSALTACGTEPDQTEADQKREGEDAGDDLELASSDAERSPGVVDAIPDAVASLTALAAGLYDALAAKPGNLVLSPYSVAAALAMAVNGAEGETAEEMQDVLSIADLDRSTTG